MDIKESVQAVLPDVCYTPIPPRTNHQLCGLQMQSVLPAGGNKGEITSKTLPTTLCPLLLIERTFSNMVGIIQEVNLKKEELSEEQPALKDPPSKPKWQEGEKERKLSKMHRLRNSEIA